MSEYGNAVGGCLCRAVRPRLAAGRWPGEIHVEAAAIEGGPDRAPQGHAVWDSHVSWTDADPDLPKRSEADIVARLPSSG